MGGVRTHPGAVIGGVLPIAPGRRRVEVAGVVIVGGDEPGLLRIPERLAGRVAGTPTRPDHNQQRVGGLCPVFQYSRRLSRGDVGRRNRLEPVVYPSFHHYRIGREPGDVARAVNDPPRGAIDQIARAAVAHGDRVFPAHGFGDLVGDAVAHADRPGRLRDRRDPAADRAAGVAVAHEQGGDRAGWERGRGDRAARRDVAAPEVDVLVEVEIDRVSPRAGRKGFLDAEDVAGVRDHALGGVRPLPIDLGADAVARVERADAVIEGRAGDREASAPAVIGLLRRSSVGGRCVLPRCRRAARASAAPVDEHRVGRARCHRAGGNVLNDRDAIGADVASRSAQLRDDGRVGQHAAAAQAGTGDEGAGA